MVKKVESALKKAGFAPEQIHLESTSTGKVGGYVVSDKFRHKKQIKRQEMIWDVLEKELSKPDLMRVVSILTMTPAEVEDDGSED